MQIKQDYDRNDQGKQLIRLQIENDNEVAGAILITLNRGSHHLSEKILNAIKLLNS